MAAGRRGNNEGTIRQRADGRWEGRVTLADGSQNYYYGKKRADVQKDLLAALKKRQDGLPIMRNEKLTIGEFLKSWLDTAAKGRVRPLTYRYYKQKIEGHILPGLGRVRLVQLTTPRIQEFLNERHEAGLSPKTVTHLRDLIRAALNDAEEWGYIVRNPAKWADPVAGRGSSGAQGASRPPDVGAQGG